MANCTVPPLNSLDLFSLPEIKALIQATGSIFYNWWHCLGDRAFFFLYHSTNTLPRFEALSTEGSIDSYNIWSEYLKNSRGGEIRLELSYNAGWSAISTLLTPFLSLRKSLHALLPFLRLHANAQLHLLQSPFSHCSNTHPV